MIMQNNYNYNTDINIIGSIPDYHLVYRAFELYSRNDDSLGNIIVDKNEFNFRTEKSRKRFLSLINSAFLNFRNKDHDELIKVLFLKNVSIETKQLILFWQFALNNRLFFEITRDVFLKNYYMGRTALPKDDIIAYLKDLQSRQPELANKWSEKTVDIIASKYLTFLKKVNLVEGMQRKKFKHLLISNEALTVFIYLVKAVETTDLNFLKSDFQPFSFLLVTNFIERAKKLAKQGIININFDGVKLTIELKNSFKEIGNVIYNRT